jgi:hypothetical protein
MGDTCVTTWVTSGSLDSVSSASCCSSSIGGDGVTSRLPRLIEAPGKMPAHA